MEQGLRSNVQGQRLTANGMEQPTVPGAAQSRRSAIVLEKQFAQGKSVFLQGGLQRASPRDTGQQSMGAMIPRQSGVKSHGLTKTLLLFLAWPLLLTRGSPGWMLKGLQHQYCRPPPLCQGESRPGVPADICI